MFRRFFWLPPTHIAVKPTVSGNLHMAGQWQAFLFYRSSSGFNILLVSGWQRFCSISVHRNIKPTVMQAIVNSIQKLLKQKLNIYATVLTPKTDLKKDLDLVDWEMLYLLNAVEKKWHVSITQNDQDSIGNIEQLVAVVRKQSNGRS